MHILLWILFIHSAYILLQIFYFCKLQTTASIIIIVCSTMRNLSKRILTMNEPFFNNFSTLDRYRIIDLFVVNASTCIIIFLIFTITRFVLAKDQSKSLTE